MPTRSLARERSRREKNRAPSVPGAAAPAGITACFRVVGAVFRTVAYLELVLIEWQLETHAITAWDSLDTNAADAATSTAITTASAKNFMLCLALG
jgi:hypothetical protein